MKSFKKILITGGAGYVGAKLVQKLVEKDFQVTVLDLMIYGEDVLPKHINLTVRKGDIRERFLLQGVIPGHPSKGIWLVYRMILASS
jgi:UDP-glucose 4-epimerase